jgi:hypothetical protein
MKQLNTYDTKEEGEAALDVCLKRKAFALASLLNQIGAIKKVSSSFLTSPAYS